MNIRSKVELALGDRVADVSYAPLSSVPTYLYFCLEMYVYIIPADTACTLRVNWFQTQLPGIL